MKSRFSFFILIISYVIFFSLIFSGSAFAEENVSKSETNSVYHFFLGAGSDYRPERDVEKNYSRHYYSNYVAGIERDRLTLMLEKSEFKESSGNATLNLERKFEDYLLWARYRVAATGILSSYAGLGMGIYKESVTTNFSGASSTSSSKDKLFSSGCLGLRVTKFIFFADIEARLLFGDELDQQGSLSGVARLGLWF